MSYTIDNFKSDLKEFADKLKEKFSVKEEKFIDAKLQDGTIVRVEADNFQIGQPMFVVDQDGLTPIADGKYVFESGEMLVVEAGAVKEFEPKQEAAPVADEAAPEEQMNGAQAEEKAQPKRYIERVEKEHIFELVKEIVKEDFEAVNKLIEDKYSAMVTENEELKKTNEEMEKNFKSLVEIFSKFAAQPSEKPKEKKNGFKKASKNITQEEIDNFRKEHGL